MENTTRSPFTVLIDTKETTPWSFNDIPGMRGEGRLLVPTRRQALGLGMGDYTIAEARSSTTTWQMSIERKSIGDLFSTILAERKRFIRELEKLSCMKYAAVIVEAPLEKVLSHFPAYWTEMEMSPGVQLGKQRQVVGSIRAWQLRYPIVRWWFLSRSYCPIWAYRLMHRFWTDVVK